MVFNDRDALSVPRCALCLLTQGICRRATDGMDILTAI
jgi:hypothetical protein